MTKTSQIHSVDSAGILTTKIQIEGLEPIMRGLKRSDASIKKALTKSLKEASEPVLRRARANAQKIADDGTLAGSLSIASRKGGVQYILKSTDEAAPVKEFARAGAVATRSYRQTRRSRMMVRKHSRIGVPRRANPPRVMIPAVNDSANEVQELIDKALEDVMEEIAHG